MTDKIEISKMDVKPFQTIAWVLTGISILPIAIMLVNDFTWNIFSVFIWGLVFNVAVHYWSTKTWNIWYENGNIFFNNIYSTKVQNINTFLKVEMKSTLGIDYILYLDSGESYHFKIKPTDDFKLFFKNDSQFYAKEITSKLNKIKINSK